MSRVTYEDVHRLVLQMREGSTEARRELIEAHVGLAFKVSREFEDDEALSDALMTLVQEVDRFKTCGKHPGALPAFLKTALGRAAATHRRHFAHNATHDAKRFIRSGRSLANHQEFERVDVLDLVLAACEDDLERAMVYWHSMDFTQQEVAVKLGVSQSAVCNTMRRLQLRFQVQERHLA